MARTEIKTGYFNNDLPYARFGDGSKNLIIFNGLDLVHKPPSGIQLSMIKNTYNCLTDEYTVYFVTRKSGMPEGYSIKDMSEDYVSMIKEEFGVAIDIVGISAGGVIAQQFVLDHPDLVKRLVLISTAYRMSDEAKNMMSSVCELARKGKGRSVSSTIIGCVYTNGFKKYLYKSLMWLFPPMLFNPKTGPSDGVIEMEALLNYPDFKEQLTNIKVPTLVLGGNQDFFVSESILRETADVIPDAKLILYEGRGHDAALTSKMLAEDTLKFLTQNN